MPYLINLLIFFCCVRAQFQLIKGKVLNLQYRYRHFWNWQELSIDCVIGFVDQYHTNGLRNRPIRVVHIYMYAKIYPSAQPARRWSIVSPLCSTLKVPDNRKNSLSCLIERYDSPQSSIDPASQISCLCLHIPTLLLRKNMTVFKSITFREYNCYKYNFYFYFNSTY